jgi:hypothetical protein
MVFFSMGNLVGLSPKIYETPSKIHIFYIVLHLQCFAQPCKTIYVYLFYTYIILHGQINKKECIS